MNNPSSTSPSSIGELANRASTPILSNHGLFLSHEAASVSSQQGSLDTSGDDKSVSFQATRKRDKIVNFFRSLKPGHQVKIQIAISETKTPLARADSTDIVSAVSSVKISSSETESQPATDKGEACLNVLLKNVRRTSAGITLPKFDARIDNTSQLALCISLLSRNTPSSLQCEDLKRSVDPTHEIWQTMPASSAEQEWAIAQNTIKQHRLRWLASRIVEEFIKKAVKDPVAVSEVVLLGSVLDQAHYRSLLNCFIEQLKESVLLDFNLLQGLVQLVRSASPTYLDGDDLIKILSILRERLGGTFQHSSEHLYYLTLAVARLLDVMAEPEHNIKDLPRVEEREPLASVLSGLQTSSDPYLMYQALYAFQALQYVPDEESVLQAVMRHSLGAAEGFVKVSGVIQLNFDGLLEGLKQIQETVEKTYGVAKSSCEGVRALIDSGRGLFDSLRDGLFSCHKQPWYPAVLSATALCRAGQLEDLGRLIQEAPCRRDSRFQWGVSQLLGEIALDPIWEHSTREQAVHFLGDLYLNDADWGQDDSVKFLIVAILGKISDAAGPTIQEVANTLLEILKKNGAAVATHSYPLGSHFAIPPTSPLLTLVQEIPYVEDDIDNLRSQRLQEYTQTVYIPPQATATDKDILPLMGMVKRFLDSDKQVFLVLGDSGAGKSTFNRHLENELWEDYTPGGPIPLFINLPFIQNPEKKLIQEQLETYGFSATIIKELKNCRQLILICDGYDETQLQFNNLHASNLLNKKGQWDTKMVISCRSAYLGLNYKNRFQPQLADRHKQKKDYTSPFFQEAAIVPFSASQIEDYIKQYVVATKSQKLSDNRSVWNPKEYMSILRTVPSLMELVTNPFLLTMVLQTLPDISLDQDPSTITFSRTMLYDEFIKQWLETEIQRLGESKLKDEASSVREILLESDDFAATVIVFLKKLADAIYREQSGNPIIQYTHSVDEKTWKGEFFGPDTATRMKRESSPLRREGTQYRFLHRSLLEYFYTFQKHELHQLKCRRLAEYDQSRYVPILAKASLQGSDRDSFPLGNKVEEFLQSHGQVFLILGDPGSGKSTLSRHFENILWKAYRYGDPIPLFISMAAIRHSYPSIIEQQLQLNNFPHDVIQELMEQHTFILFCDGYDESQLKINLHTTNMLNQKNYADCKMIINCRSTSLEQDYHDLFRPQQNDRHGGVEANLYREAVIVPFSGDQIANYVNQFVRDPEVHKLMGRGRVWSTEEYMTTLKSVPNLMELVKNPFLLKLSLRALPAVLKNAVDLASVKVTRLTLYDSFINQWLNTNKLRLKTLSLSGDAAAARDDLLEEGFVQTAIEFSKNLAAAIFREQAGNPVVQYVPRTEKGTWKAKFFGSQADITILRDSSPLSRAGLQYQFIHRSLLEYFYSRHIYETDAAGSLTSADSPDLANQSMNQTNLVKEPSIIDFLAEHVQRDLDFKERLHQTIELSKSDATASQAAANAITVLVRSGVTFNGADLRGIRIQGADLSGGLFDSAQLQGADLSNTNLRNIWLRQADLSNAQMTGVQFGEWPYLKEEHEVDSCAYSPDGKTLVLGIRSGSINLYDTATWEKSHTLNGHICRVSSVVVSPSGRKIASGGYDKTVRLWDAQTGAMEVISTGHTSEVRSVAFSPSGQQIASASEDNTVRLWDVQTGATCAILRGHTLPARSVAFSPSGHQIASGSSDNTVQIWDAETGAPGAILCGHVSAVTSVAFSPRGQQVASGSLDGTVRLWDAQTGAPGVILSGCTSEVTSVVFSPNGQQIASSYSDGTVRLWDALTGAPGAILNGHASEVASVVFSPSGQQIASSSSDKTVRLWDAQTVAPRATVEAHTRWMSSVVFSPSGQQIASGSLDMTVRLWDAQTGAPGAILSGHDSEVTSVVFSPSGKQIASGNSDKTVKLWDAQTGDPGAILRGHTDSVSSVVFSPSGQQIASGSVDCTVRLWDAQTGGSVAILKGHLNSVMSVVFSPSGQQIASGSVDYTVRLWDAQTGGSAAILKGHTDSVRSVMFSPSGQQIASGSDDNTVRLWDAQTYTLAATLTGHDDNVVSVTYSPSGQQIASGSWDKTVLLWDVESRQCLFVVKGFCDHVDSVSWSPSVGNMFVTISRERSIRLWEVVEDADQVVVRMLWGSAQDQLVVVDSTIQNAQGLSAINVRLLEQRGALNVRAPHPLP